MSNAAISPSETGLAIAVWVVPGGVPICDRRPPRRPSQDPSGSSARRGRANDEVARVLGETLQAGVTLKRGMRGRAKVFEVSCTDIAAVREKLGL